MKNFTVKIPIAGHLTFDVEAESEEQAKEIAFDTDPDKGDLSWDLLEQFHEGNVCHCPSPWSVEVEEN